MASTAESLSAASRGDHHEHPHHDHDHDIDATARILTAKYLERNSGKKDLILRLRKVVEVLRDDDTVEPDSVEFPGLAALCQQLVQYVDHRDKLVRLYTISACMELFTVYAPDAPWSTEETLEIFRQTIRQLANLAHTTNPANPHYADYARILDLLAKVKIGVILVEMTKDEECKGEALPVLADLFRTLLQSVRTEHPPDIAEMIQTTICGCFEEFHDGIMLPIPLIDELLVCIGQGPRVLVINPQKAAAHLEAAPKQQKKHLPLHHVEQTNPSFIVASAIIRTSVDRLSTPIAALLNGLLNNDARWVSESAISTQLVKQIAKPQTQDQNSQADVYNIIYELHRVAPTILTTVVGTLTNFLSVPEVDQRKLVVQLLGKLFVKSPTKFATQFRPCYRQWLERAQDKDVSIRLIMVQHLLLLILAGGSTEVVGDGLDQISLEAQSMLKACLEDPTSEVRLQTIHGICDTAYRYPTAVSLDTWVAVGFKVTTKQKQERKDALTGLVQTYFNHYMAKRLKEVQAGGDDVPLDIVEQTMEAAENSDVAIENERARFEWIPSRVFECASWQDDAELQSRVWQAMDDMLLGSELSTSAKKLTSTARAVGLALLIDSLEENAFSWLGSLLRERSRLQQKMSEYMDARAKIKEVPVGSTEHLTENANALDLLEAVASFTEFATSNDGERNPVLERFHMAKDRHIFRILSTIVTPTHSVKARVRAFEELPKRVKSLGDTTVRFVKSLARKCAMGDFLNQEIVHDCILLAQEFGVNGAWKHCRKFIRCIEIAADYFPDICGDTQCFQNLSELFSECRASKDRGIDDVLTSLTSILAKAAPRRKVEVGDVDSTLREDLLRFCRSGTPAQARHAVKTLTSMSLLEAPGKMKMLETLLGSLASPSVLSLETGNERLVTTLAALSEFAEASPQTMSSARGKKAVKFALESVLLGRGHPSTDDENEIQDDGENQMTRTPRRGGTTTPKGTRAAKRKHLSPGANSDLLADINLSLTCRKLCSSIEFLTTYTRSAIFASVNPDSSTSSDIDLRPSDDIIDKVFDTLCHILRDGGMPPSNLDHNDCSLRQDRSALRQCAAINLLRLCDPRLSLDQRFLTTKRWHTLAGVFLDDERIVRERIIEELGFMLTGHGKYGKHANAGQAMIPRFNFLAFVTLCTDSDNSRANGNAANVGKRASTIKMNALHCVQELRKKYELESEQARANGSEAERQFELQMKVRLMPEYVVPFAFHLLAFRPETPLRTDKPNARPVADDDSYEDKGSNEYYDVQDRVLRKRLKWLFDPLVLSLGDTADNISFLIRMSDKIGSFMPVGNHSSVQADDEKSTLRLKIVSEAARKVLMSYVKKDVNLATFPGQILLPGSLFRKIPVKKSADDQTTATATVASKRVKSKTTNRQSQSVESDDENSATQDFSPKVAMTSGPKRSSRSRRSVEASHVHFSPDVATDEVHEPSNFGALSPIERKFSVGGSPSAVLDSSEKTRGTTPPSALRDISFTSTASLRSSATVTESPSSRNSNRKRSLRSSSGDAQLSQTATQSTSMTEGDGSSMSKKRKKDKSISRPKTATKSVPKQIKVVRNRSIPDVSSSIQVTRKGTAKQSEAANLDFEPDDRVGSKDSRKQSRSTSNKENVAQPPMRSSKRSAKK